MKTFCIVNSDISDGSHTFDELYEHRFALWMVLCREFASNPAHQHGPRSEVWRSRLHSDGSQYDGWFLLGIGKNPGEQITYHLPNEKWGCCEFAQTLERAPEFDGHTSADVLDRLGRT
jgi:hypothetical protein